MINKHMFVQTLRVIALFILLCGLEGCYPTQPTQEGAGPGDNTYICDPETDGVFGPNEPRRIWGTDPGLGEFGGYIYAPTCAERPEYAPVIFFFHWGAGDRTDDYMGFFKHLAGKGYIVIAPNYHFPYVGGEATPIFQQLTTEWRDRGIKGAQAGYLYYRNTLPGQLNSTEFPYGIPGPLLDQGELVYGVAGHSFGTAVAASLANPTMRNLVVDDGSFNWNPKAVVMMAGGTVGDILLRCPGGADLAYCCPSCWSNSLRWVPATFFEIDNDYLFYLLDPENWEPRPDVCAYGEYPPDVPFPWDDNPQHCMATDGSFLSGKLDDINYNPLWVVMAAEDDTATGETAPLQAFCKATQIIDKHYLRVLTDDYGQPALEAKHEDPAEALVTMLGIQLWKGKEDAHDYYAYWKIVTAAMDCATQGENCNYVRGGTQEQLYMGNWIGGDNRAVKRMQYNPRVRDNEGNCYSLEEACNMVNNIVYEDGVTRISAWNWRDNNNMPAISDDINDLCYLGGVDDACYEHGDCVSGICGTDGFCD